MNLIPVLVLLGMMAEEFSDKKNNLCHSGKNKLSGPFIVYGKLLFEREKNVFPNFDISWRKKRLVQITP